MYRLNTHKVTEKFLKVQSEDVIYVTFSQIFLISTSLMFEMGRQFTKLCTTSSYCVDQLSSTKSLDMLIIFFSSTKLHCICTNNTMLCMLLNCM